MELKLGDSFLVNGRRYVINGITETRNSEASCLRHHATINLNEPPEAFDRRMDSDA